jgi:hypothetical protein
MTQHTGPGEGLTAEQLGTDRHLLQMENDRFQRENEALWGHLKDIMDVIDLGRAVDDEGAPLSRYRAVKDAFAFMASTLATPAVTGEEESND